MISYALISTPDFFGIGEFWSGLVVGIGALFLALVTFFWWIDRDIGRDLSDLDERSGLDRPAGAGVLVCDYVDGNMLETIAKQKGIELSPKESERGRRVTREGSVGFQKLPIIGRLAGSRSDEERLRWEHREDHNVLLSSLLKCLETAGELRRDLTRAPDVSLVSPQVLDELADMAGKHDEAQTARVAINTISKRLIAERKAAEFNAAVESRAFILVEGRWRIDSDGQNVTLRLKNLWPPAGPPFEPQGDPIDMPSGVELRVNVSIEDLSTQGRDRLGVAEQSVAVFGVAASAQDGSLRVSPIALFGRYGVSEEGMAGRRPDVPPEYLAGYPGAC